MGLIDPKRLALLLEDLLQEVMRWSALASDTLEEAKYAQRYTHERVIQTSRRARILNSRALDDRILYQTKSTDVSILIGNCEEGVKIAETALKELELVRQKAHDTLNHWNGEKRQADEWLSRADRRLSKARQALDNTNATLTQAKSRLQRAEEDLRKCRNASTTDKQGRRVRQNCGKYETAVRMAQVDVTDAEAKVKIAESELKDAEKEHKRATERVNCCDRAVSLATQAVERAESAHQRAADGLSTAERALEHAHAAQRALEQARTLLEAEEEEVDLMLREAQHAENSVDEAQLHLRNTLRYEESAQRYHVIARAEINTRLVYLREINRPDLFGLGTYAASEYGPATGNLAALDMLLHDAAEREADDEADLSEWVTVFTQVPVNHLPNPEEFRDEYDFEQDVLNTLREALNRLQVMQPYIESGDGHQRAYWEARDAQEQLPGEATYCSVYDLFYGDEAIRVTKTDNGYDITQGRERVWLAKRLGVKTLPVHLSRRRHYLPRRKFEDEQGTQWQFRTYEDGPTLMLRLFDLARREVLPNGVDPGDAGHVDVTIEDDAGTLRAQITAFEVTTADRDRGIDRALLDQAERASRARGAASIYFTMNNTTSRSPAIREWYRAQGYVFRRQTRETMVYKVFQPETFDDRSI
jgi:ribosomal protein S18 acetylase RimI-like enzyme